MLDCVNILGECEQGKVGTHGLCASLSLPILYHSLWTLTLSVLISTVIRWELSFEGMYKMRVCTTVTVTKPLL